MLASRLSVECLAACIFFACYLFPCKGGPTPSSVYSVKRPSVIVSCTLHLLWSRCSQTCTPVCIRRLFEVAFYDCEHLCGTKRLHFLARSRFTRDCSIPGHYGFELHCPCQWTRSWSWKSPACNFDHVILCDVLFVLLLAEQASVETMSGREKKKKTQLCCQWPKWFVDVMLYISFGTKLVHLSLCFGYVWCSWWIFWGRKCWQCRLEILSSVCHKTESSAFITKPSHLFTLRAKAV